MKKSFPIVCLTTILILISCDGPSKNRINRIWNINIHHLNISVLEYEERWFLSNGYCYIEMSTKKSSKNQIDNFKKQLLAMDAKPLASYREKEFSLPTMFKEKENKYLTQYCNGLFYSNEYRDSERKIIILDEDENKIILCYYI